GALTGMGYGTLMPAAQAITVDAVPAAQIGTGLSTLFLFTDLGFGLGPVLLGVLLGGVGYGGMFAMLSGVVVLAGIYYAATRACRQRPAR
ncbi:MAG: MFS transporter, partial [Corynebacterium sp.]|nr:MFS transporter [Corynebacterium sp.]